MAHLKRMMPIVDIESERVLYPSPRSNIFFIQPKELQAIEDIDNVATWGMVSWLRQIAMTSD